MSHDYNHKTLPCGTLVRLKSGGPSMTVENVERVEMQEEIPLMVHVWYVCDGEINYAIFPAPCLVLVDADAIDPKATWANRLGVDNLNELSQQNSAEPIPHQDK